VPTTAIAYQENRVIVSADTNYQGFEYDPVSEICTPTNKRMILKWAALKDVFPALVQDKGVIDLGANFGFLCFKAIEHGAHWAVAVESKAEYLDPMFVLCRWLERRVRWTRLKFPRDTGHMNADVVCCLSLLHHVFPKCSLEDVLDALHEMANEAVILEWISPEDRAIVRKGWGPSHPEYNEERFLELARDRFGEVAFVAHGHHDTRKIYLLKKG
jgi:SAM-dependent methyltransferase